MRPSANHAPVDDVVVGRGAIREEEVLVPEAAALEPLRVVDLLVEPDDRREVVQLRREGHEPTLSSMINSSD